MNLVDMHLPQQRSTDTLGPSEMSSVHFNPTSALKVRQHVQSALRIGTKPRWKRSVTGSQRPA
jgi:hypothetical protein